MEEVIAMSMNVIRAVDAAAMERGRDALFLIRTSVGKHPRPQPSSTTLKAGGFSNEQSHYDMMLLFVLQYYRV